MRPGPIQGGMVHPYLKRRQGKEPVTYPSDAVKSVLERTLGVPIFQEQVMQLAIVAAGFTPGEADHLRRSMAAWRRKGGLEKFEQRLIDGMGARGYSEAFARQIYQQILGFGEYGFPESHSASFALLVYTSAWLKRYYPAAFTGALLNSQPMGFYAPSQLVQDARRHAVVVLPPDATVSDWDCTLEGPALRLGLRMIAGLTEAGAQRLVAARRTRAFDDVADLAHRAALTGAISRASPTRTRCVRSPAIATARCGTSPASSGCRQSSREARSTKPRPISPRLPRARTSSPTTGRWRSRCAGTSRPPARATPQAAPAHRRGDHAGAARPHRAHRRHRHRAAAARHRERRRVRHAGRRNRRDQRDRLARSGDRQRRELLGAKLLAVYGNVEREGDVVHVQAGRLVDLSPLLGALETRSRDFH